MILAPRPQFRASRRPPRPGYQGFQQAYRTAVSPDLGIPGFSDYRVLHAAPRATVQGVPGKEFRRKPLLRAGFRCPLPSWNPSEALPYESLPCESPGWPPGWQTSPEPVSTAICTKDNLRQYVAPLYTQEPSITPDLIPINSYLRVEFSLNQIQSKKFEGKPTPAPKRPDQLLVPDGYRGPKQSSSNSSTYESHDQYRDRCLPGVLQPAEASPGFGLPDSSRGIPKWPGREEGSSTRSRTAIRHGET